MLKRFRFTIIIIELFLPDLIGIVFNMSQNLLLITFAISLITTFTIEYFGFNHKILSWIDNKLKTKHNIPILPTINNDILTVSQTLDYLREFNIKNFNDYKNILLVLGIERKEVISQNLYNLLKYAVQKDIVIYRQRTKTINNIITLPFERADIITFCYKDNWSEDLTSLYSDGNLIFTNLHVKKSELDNLIEKFAIQRPSNLI